MQKPGQSLPNSQGGAQQQNISINISYNLNTHKIPKSILGAKKSISKSKKIHTPVMQSIGNQFFSNMAFNPVNQSKKPAKKQNLSKKSNESSQAAKQSKPHAQKKTGSKKKKVRETTITQPNLPPQDAVIEYYNPLANNSKHFLKRNIQSPDIFKADYNRKLKTQASNYEPNESTFKKLKRSTGHMKETQSGFLSKNLKLNNFLKDTAFNFASHKVPTSTSTVLKKPSMGSSKTPKARKSAHQIKQKQKRVYTQENENPIMNQIPQARHNKSCMLYSTKKQGLIAQPHLIETAEHILSNFVSTNSQKLPRKRAQSAYSFNRNGKELVSKLLNMSMISSELGSSQLISSERMKSGRNDLTRKRLGLKVDEFDQFNHYQNNFEIGEGEGNNKRPRQPQNQEVLPGNALRQYLNSIDLRIIKNIENDTANIALPKGQKADKASNRSRQLDKNSFFINQGSRINQIPLQENDRKSQESNDVISFYNKLFSNALYNKRIQQEQQKYLDSANLESQRQSLSIDFNESAKVKKEKFVIDAFDDSDQFDQDISGSKNQTQEVYEFVKSSKPQGSRKLNFQHYKDLLNKQANGSKEKQQISDETRKKSQNRFDFHLMAVENDMEFVPYSKKATQAEDSRRSSKQKSSPQQEPSSEQDPDLQQKAIISLIDKSFRPSSSPSSGSSLSQMRQEHVERWNHMNKLKEAKGIHDEWSDRVNKLEEEKQFLISQQLMNREYFESVINEVEPHEKNDHDQSNQEDEDSPLLSQQRIVVKENTADIFTNKLINAIHSNNQNQDKNSIETPKEGKTSSRKKLSNLEPEYNEVCWEYDPDELDRQIQNYHKHQNLVQLPHNKNHQNILSKTLKPNRQVYSNSPNGFSQDGNHSGEDQYDSKKYSQVSVYKDTVLEDNYSGVAENSKTTFQSNQKAQTGKQNEQLSNSLIDSLEDGDDDALSFEEREIGSDNRWINTNFAHHQSLNETHHHQSFSDTHGRIKKISDSKNEKELQGDQHSQDYLECDLASFGVKNQQKSQQSIKPQKLTKSKSPNQPSVSANTTTINQVLDALSQEKASQVVESHFKLTINGKQTKEKITLQVNQLTQNGKVDSNNAQSSKTTQKINTFSQIRRKRLTHIVEDIILEMIREFARDISYILKKSSYEKRTQQQMEENSSPFRSYKQSHQENELSPFSRQAEAIEAMNAQNSRKQQLKKNQFVGKCFGIDTSFMSVQKYLKEFKEYLLKDDNMKKQIIKNINKDIGPNSLQILSYLRPEYDNMDSQNDLQGQLAESANQQENCDDEDGLFVVPSEAFSQFENYLEQQIEQKNKSLEPQKQIILTQKQKRNTNFWHRGIYESWNEFLDYERPYGINGKPYEWVKEKKKFREVQLEEVEKKLQKGIDKLLQAISLPSGIIYDKYDLPAMYSDLSEEQKMYLNEQRLSRMLAIQLFQSEQTWINYNDQMAQLLVELGRIIEDRIFFQMTTEMKKVFRKRNLLSNGVERVGNLQGVMVEEILEEQDQEQSSRNEEDEESMNRKWLVEEEGQQEEEEQEEED